MNEEVIQVLIIDDHEVVREGIKILLRDSTHIEVIGEVDAYEGAYQAVSTLMPDVVLLDIRLGKADGLTLARKIKAEYQNAIRIIVLSSYDDEVYINRSIRSHVDGYLLKTTSADYLSEAIESVMHGEMAVSPEIGSVLFKSTQNHAAGEHPALEQQDKKILELLAEGKSVLEIAGELNYSERTTKRRISSIVTSLEVKNRTQAVSKAIRLGLI